VQILLESSPHIDPKVLNFPVYDLDAVFRQKTEDIWGQYVQKLPGSETAYAKGCLPRFPDFSVQESRHALWSQKVMLPRFTRFR
jgi:hypothetical protein